MKRILLIFLHGYGANGADLESLGPFFKDLASEVIIESPNALEPMPDYPGGYQWFPIGDMSEAHLKVSCDNISSDVIKMIRGFQAKHGVEHNETYLIGFSQGTMMALYSALSQRDLVCGVVGFSGGLFMDSSKIKSDNTLKIIFIHGEEDDVVPATASVKSYDFLKGQGFSPEITLLDGLPHSIDMRGIKIAKGFIRKTLNIVEAF